MTQNVAVYRQKRKNSKKATPDAKESASIGNVFHFGIQKQQFLKLVFWSRRDQDARAAGKLEIWMWFVGRGCVNASGGSQIMCAKKCENSKGDTETDNILPGPMS